MMVILRAVAGGQTVMMIRITAGLRSILVYPRERTRHNGLVTLTMTATVLSTFQEFGLKSIDLDYKESKRTDQYGNQFRYRAKVKDTNDAQLGRWAWDVFLV